MNDASNSTTTSSGRNRARTILLWGSGALVVLLLIVGVGSYAYAKQSNTILRNVMVGDIHVGGLNALQALTELENAWDVFSAEAFVFTYQEQRVPIPISNLATSNEESQQVILDLANFDVQKSIDAAYDYGHSGPVWQQAWDRLLAFLGQSKAFGSFTISTGELELLLEKNFGEHDQPAVDAGIAVVNGVASVTPSAPGEVINYAQALATAKNRLRSLDRTPIAITTAVVQPDIPSSPQLTQLLDDVPAIVNRAPLKLTIPEQSWEISGAQLADLLGFVVRDGRIALGLDAAKTEAWLELLRPEIDIAPRDAKFNVVNGRVEEFQTSVVGKSLNAVQTIAAMEHEYFLVAASTAEAVVDEKLPLTDTVSTNDLGIHELVGEGETDFRGSPPNRVYNLRLGGERIHGLILKPGETFSLVDALGPIDQAHGWKPELVIKGSKITPEYGGGLCQVATTLFRAVLNTGLPVVERRNHSLRVSYYEPPIGLDATIYEPKPDLRFSNDYQKSLLIQSRIEGTKMIFSFYGTKDGRTVDLPKPTVYNQTAIPATLTHETDELAPGEQECQNGYPGADATVTYTVTKADGSSESQTFNSHYRALPKICRVGKAAPAPIPDES